MANIGRTAIMLVTGALFGGSACAMSSPVTQSPRCRVVDGAKLPQGSGGSAPLCAAIERALTAHAVEGEVAVEVRVLSRSRLAATVTAQGRTLPEQNFASMDRDLDRHSFERFAASLAEQVAKARR